MASEGIADAPLCNFPYLGAGKFCKNGWLLEGEGNVPLTAHQPRLQLGIYHPGRNRDSKWLVRLFQSYLPENCYHDESQLTFSKPGKSN